MRSHHIGYAVSNIHESLELFKALGYELVEDPIKDEKRKVEIAFVRNNELLVELIAPLKVQIIKQLNLEDMEPDDIDPDEPLFGDGLGLDSIDALELIVLLEKEYGIKIENPKDGQKIFYSVRSLAKFITEHQK